MGDVGSLDDSILEEWPVWRIVLEGRSLQEVDLWSYEDIMKFNAVLDMRQDYEAAGDAWNGREIE